MKKEQAKTANDDAIMLGGEEGRRPPNTCIHPTDWRSLALDFFKNALSVATRRPAVALIFWFGYVTGCPPEAAKGSSRHDVRAQPRLLWTGESMSVVFGVVVMVG